MKCCGQTCQTAFCPHCGKKLRADHPLRELVVHLRTVAKGARTNAHNHRLGADDARNADYARKLAANADAKAAKFDAWADTLELLIDPEPEEGGE